MSRIDFAAVDLRIRHDLQRVRNDLTGRAVIAHGGGPEGEIIAVNLEPCGAVMLTVRLAGNRKLRVRLDAVAVGERIAKPAVSHRDRRRKRVLTPRTGSAPPLRMIV